MGAANRAPIEPAADTTPRMRLRLSAGTALVATAIPIPEPLHASAQPIKNPAPIVTATTPLAKAKVIIPKRYKKDPATHDCFKTNSCHPHSSKGLH
jgi:hypothetical protein